MRYQTPVKSIHDNLMLTHQGDLWATYIIPAKVIASKNQDTLSQYKKQYRQFFRELHYYKDFHLEMYPRQFNIEERFNKLSKDFSSQTNDVAHYYSEETINLLRGEMGEITENEFVLSVPIKKNLLNEAIDTKEMIKKSFSGVADVMAQWLGLEQDLTDEFFQQFVQIEQDLYDLVAMVGGTRVSEDHLIYINRYNFLRDIQHSYEEEKRAQGVSGLSNTLIDPTNPGFLRLQTPDGECYMSFVVIDKLPGDLANNHLYEQAQQLSFPVELHIKGKFMDNDKIHRRASFVKQRFKETDKDMQDAGEDADESMLENRQKLNMLQEGLQSKEELFVQWLASFVVFGKTKEECRQRSKELRHELKRSNIECVKPVADQLQLFYTFLHGNSISAKSHWLQQSTHSGFSEVLFGISNKLGSNIGFYFGRACNMSQPYNDVDQAIASSRDIVLFHPFMANEGITGASTDSPHISITGQTGKGKSFLVKLILMYLSFINCKVVMTDPKSEISSWFQKAVDNPIIREKYPLFVELLESIHYVTLDAGNSANWGILDPITFLEGHEAKDTAYAVISSIYNMEQKDDVRSAVLKCLDDVIADRQQGKHVGMKSVVQQLQASEEKNIRQAGELLHQLSTNSVLQLCFSDGHQQGIRLENKINVLQMQGLSLPQEGDDPNYYSDSERKSVTMMIPLAKFCEKFGSRDREEQTAIIFDEAWSLTEAKEGKKMVKSLRRVGRSYKNQLYLVTQSVSDVQNEDKGGNFGARFAFDESAERGDILTFMGMDDNEKNRDMLQEMKKGMCLFRDFYGRSGMLAIDCLFDEWKEAFKTVEKSHAAQAEEEMAT